MKRLSLILIAALMALHASPAPQCSDGGKPYIDFRNGVIEVSTATVCVMR